MNPASYIHRALVRLRRHTHPDAALAPSEEQQSAARRILELAPITKEPSVYVGHDGSLIVEWWPHGDQQPALSFCVFPNKVLYQLSHGCARTREREEGVVRSESEISEVLGKFFKLEAA